MTKTIQIGDPKVEPVSIGPETLLFIQAGPCVIENRDLCFTIAEHMLTLCRRLGLPYIFKASFDKANRSHPSSFRGPGLDEGLRILDEVRTHFRVPVVSDIHLPDQAGPAAEVLDILQIPAFLARQTDLLTAAAGTGKPVQVKKAQFMAPWDMKNVIEKITAAGNDEIMLIERGVSFGYNRLICDMTAIAHLQQYGRPVILDATHATQQPSGLGAVSGGSPQLAQVLARAGIGAGADGLFLETHPQPDQALSDAACMIPLDQMASLLSCCRQIALCVRDHQPTAGP